jgi:peptidoglycan/LPS O-acetylase OafA/YrhL
MTVTVNNGHFWSLCVEIQFYVGIIFLVGILRDRGFYFIPFLCLAVTLYRVEHQAYANINTYFRGDEILSGCVLAMVYSSRLGESIKLFVKNSNPYIVLLFWLASCHPDSGWLNYCRPYLAMLLIGTTIIGQTRLLNVGLNVKSLAYIASISYALYVIHGGLVHTWLGEGEGLEKYIKRVPLFMITFFLAHVSTFYYEKKINSWARRLTARDS